MASLLNLPHAVLYSVVLEWQTLKDVAQLDSALCNHKRRTEFLNLIKSGKSSMQKLDLTSERIPFVWIEKKQLKFRHVEMHRPWLEDEGRRKQVLGRYGSRLHSLKLNFVMTAPQKKLVSNDSESDDDDSGLIEDWITTKLPNYDAIWTDIITMCPHLTSLTLYTAGDDWTFKSKDNSFDHFLLQCPYLTHLEIANCRVIGPSMLTAICAAPMLTTLTLRECRFSKPFSLVDIPVNLQICSLAVHNLEDDLLPLFPAVTKLDMIIHASDGDRSIAEYSSLSVITHVLSLTQSAHLTHLSLITLQLLPRHTLSQISMHCPLIQELTLDNATAFDESDVIILIEKCPSLTKLHITEAQISWYDPKYMPSACSKGVYGKHTTFPSHYAGSRLRELRLCMYQESTLQCIVDQCPYLHTLVMHNPSQRNACSVPRAITALHYVCYSNVRVLEMYGYDTLSDDHILQLQHSNLEGLVFGGAKQVTGTAVVTLVTTLPNLSAIGLQKCRKVAGSDVCAVLNKCAKLCSLSYRHSFTMDYKQSGLDVMLACLVKQWYPHVKHVDF